MDIPEIERLVGSYVPDRFLRSAIQSVFLARKEAHAHCVGEFAAPEYANVTPYYLRGKTEALVRGAAELSGFPFKTINSSGWSHTEITVGPITLTTHAVDGPCGLVDRAQYRESLAESQGSFFDPAELKPTARLYALLLHGPYRGRSREEAVQYRYLPGSVYLAFPEFAQRRYAHAVNLFERYPDLVGSLLPQEWDEQAKLAYRWQATLRIA